MQCLRHSFGKISICVFFNRLLRSLHPVSRIFYNLRLSKIGSVLTSQKLVFHGGISLPDFWISGAWHHSKLSLQGYRLNLAWMCFNRAIFMNISKPFN